MPLARSLGLFSGYAKIAHLPVNLIVNLILFSVACVSTENLTVLWLFTLTYVERTEWSVSQNSN